MTIQVDSEACIALGYCFGSCSSVFEEGPDGKARVIPGQEHSVNPCVLDAKENCCPGAITT